MSKSNQDWDDPTARALLVLASDVQELEAMTSRVRAQIAALAERHGVPLPRPNR